MLAIVETFGDELPASCIGTCQEAWTIIDSLLSKYGSQYDVAERTTRVLRCGLRLFGRNASPIVPSLLSRMSIGFEATGFASFAWIAGKVISLYGEDDDIILAAGIKDVFERSTTKVATLLQEKELRDIPDGKKSFTTNKHYC